MSQKKEKKRKKKGKGKKGKKERRGENPSYLISSQILHVLRDLQFKKHLPSKAVECRNHKIG
jgi:hypothetical protein